MQLYGSLRSPYVRKVRCVAHELGFDDRIELVPVVNTPQAIDPALEDVTPVGKIPALRLPDGEVVLDSLLICERLDAMAESPRLLGDGQTRAATLFLHTVGDGMIDAVFRWLGEAWRPGDAMSSVIQNLMRTKLDRCLDWLEARQLNPSRPMLGEITVAVALAYLDFRCDAFGWRDAHPALAEWHSRIIKRRSMSATMFDGEGVVLNASA